MMNRATHFTLHRRTEPFHIRHALAVLLNEIAFNEPEVPTTLPCLREEPVAYRETTQTSGRS